MNILYVYIIYIYIYIYILHTLTLQDQLTKFCMDISLPDQITETVAEDFVDRFICILGASKVILTDQERNFILVS